MRKRLAADGATGLGVGVFSGLFGVGGGTVLVPVLVSWYRQPRKIAHATSLVAVAVLACAGVTTFAVGGHVSWWAAVTLTVGGVIGAPIGATLLRRINEQVLALSFATFLIAAAASMFLDVTPGRAELSVVTASVLVAAGVLAGALSALLGVGGGIVMVPALVLTLGTDQHLAEGTSLAAMIPITVIGAVRLARNEVTAPQWALGIRLGAAGTIGAVVGASAAIALPAVMLQRAFALLAVLIAVELGWRTLRGPRTTSAAETETPQGQA